jgi:hypothetical protein
MIAFLLSFAAPPKDELHEEHPVRRYEIHAREELTVPTFLSHAGDAA